MFEYIAIAILGLVIGCLLGFFIGWRVANKLNDIFPTWR